MRWGRRAKAQKREVMLTAEARIETDRPSRYLVQLCKHIDGIYNNEPPRAR
jgi:hypothetical protein